MEDWQERVVKERDELNTRLAALNAFVVTEGFKSLSTKAQGLLHGQGYYMKHYLDILDTRIKEFVIKEKG